MVIPSNTIISVVPPTNDDIAPDSFAANVCDSFVKNVVTASTPAAPSDPETPDDPPSILNIVVESDNPSPDVSIVNGKFAFVDANPPALVAPANVILPLTTPLNNPEEFDVILPVSKLKFVIVESCAVVIVTLLAEILDDKFCCAMLNIIFEGSADKEEADGNANTCESVVSINDLAVFDAVASFIASCTFSPDSNLNWPRTTNDDPFHVNLSPNEKFDPEST